MLKLKKSKETRYIVKWKSKGVYIFKLKLLYTAFVYSIKLSGYNVGIKFDEDPIPVKQKYYVTKTVNVYIVYDLNARPRKPLNNFKLKNCLFGTINIIKKDKEKR